MVGAKDAFVPTQLYHPDFDAINGLLRLKQSQYDQGFNAVKSAYSSILNAPITNQENQVVRQNYLKDAQEKLKNLSSVDLSLNKNQIAAEQVFQPFANDSEIAADMVKTKAFQTQFQVADNLRNSKKIEDQARYWDTGVQYLQNGLDTLRTAKRGDGSIQRVESRRYVDYVDPEKYLADEAQKDGLKIERQTSNGQYKLTRINGDEAVPLFETWAKSKLSGNNQINDMFRVQGTTLYENSVNNLVNHGMDEQNAKSSLAENYLARQANSYKSTYDNLTAYLAQLQKDSRMARELLNDQPSEENLNSYKAKLAQLDSTNQSLAQYEKLYKSLSDKTGKDYQDNYKSILNNGESFFAEHSRDAFISNWARGRASNSSVKYDIDPGFKLEESMKKEMEILEFQKAMTDERVSHVVNGVAYDKSGKPLGPASSFGNVSSTGSTSAQAKQQDMDTPIYVGLNTYGTNGASSYNRFVAAKQNALNDYVDNGLNFIQGMSHNYGGDNIQVISTGLLSELKKQLTTGQVALNAPELQQEFKQLQGAGIIPQTLNYGASPTQTYQAIKNYYSDILIKQAKNGQADTQMIGLAAREERIDKQYNNLKKIEDTELTKIKNNPKYKGLIEDDKIVDLGEYIKKQGPDISDKTINQQYEDYRQVQNQILDPITGQAAHVISRDAFHREIIAHATQQFKDEYDKKVEGFKADFGKTSYAKDENAYIAPTIRFNTDRKGTEDKAQKIAQMAMADDNFTEQDISKNGITPVNMDQLESLGADKKEVAGFLQYAQKNVADMISGVEVSKIGTNGNPMVRLVFDKQTLDEYRKAKTGLFSDATAKALGKGVEIELKNPRALDAQGLDLDFTPSSLDMLDLTLNGKASAPQILKRAGFDYSVEPSFDKKNLLVTFKYNRFEKGKLVPGSYNRSIPVAGISLNDVENNLYSSAMEIYSGNNQASTQYFKANPQVTKEQIAAIEKQFNYPKN
jgi:hypothetical protein